MVNVGGSPACLDNQGENQLAQVYLVNDREKWYVFLHHSPTEPGLLYSCSVIWQCTSVLPDLKTWGA